MTKNRRTRRALIVILTAAVVGGGAALAALADSSAAAGSQTPAAQAQGTHTVSPETPGTAAAASPAPASPGAGATRTGAPAAPGSGAGTTAPPAHTATDTSSAAVQQVQLSAAQLPARSTEKWTPSGSPSTRVIQGHDIGENECASVDGATTWTQQSFSGGGNQDNVAIQDTFAFSGASAAQTAYQTFASAMAACQQTTRALQTTNKVPADAVVTRTAQDGDAVAWQRTWTGVMGMSAAGPQTNHLYLAVGGSTLIVLQFTEFPGAAAAYDTAGDPQVLAMLQTELAR